MNDFGTGYSTGTILDSGTTYSFLKWDLYRDLSAEIESFCDKSENNCKGEKNNVSTEPHPCYRYTGVISLEDFFNTFPLV